MTMLAIERSTVPSVVARCAPPLLLVGELAGFAHCRVSQRLYSPRRLDGRGGGLGSILQPRLHRPCGRALHEPIDNPGCNQDEENLERSAEELARVGQRLVAGQIEYEVTQDAGIGAARI